MADKLRQLVSVFVEFVDGERPTAAKFNALSAQTRRGFEALEYAIGDIQNQSWPSSSPYLTVPYGSIWHQTDIMADPGNPGDGIAADPLSKKKVIGASDLGRPLDIVNLARLIGPTSNLNPQVLTQGWQEIAELISEPDAFAGMQTPPHDSTHGLSRNQFALKYPPLDFAVNFTPAGTTFVTPVSEVALVDAPGHYHISDMGLVTTYSPVPGGVTAVYKTDSLFWGGGANYLGATFNVIPDPAQIIAGGAGVGVDGPNIEGTYMLQLPVCTHAQKDWDGVGTELSNARDYNTGKQLTLPEWMTGTDSTGQPLYQPGDILPQGAIYLKCIDTNEIYNDAEYIYDSATSLEIRNVDLGENGCGLKFCIITVGTDITTSIDDLRRKQFQHSHDRRFGEPFIHITSIMGQLDQGDGSSWANRKTPLAGPYYPTRIPGDYFPQYFHRDGFRYDPHNQMGKEGDALKFGTDDQSRSVQANCNAMRGSLILGRRILQETTDSESDCFINTGVANDGMQRVSLTPGEHGAVVTLDGTDTTPYVNSRGETFHLCFGDTPTHHDWSNGVYRDGGGNPLTETNGAADFRTRSDTQDFDRLPIHAAQVYSSHINELRFEAQAFCPDFNAWKGGWGGRLDPHGSWSPFYGADLVLGISGENHGGGTDPQYQGSIIDPHGWGFGSAVPIATNTEVPLSLNPMGLGLYTEGGIVLDNRNHGSLANGDSERLSGGIKLLSNSNIIANANNEFGVVANKNIQLHANDGDISLTASVNGTQSTGRFSIGGRRLGLSFDGNSSPGYGAGSDWDSNFMTFATSLNITSGTTPLETRTGNICIHATGPNTSDSGRLILSVMGTSDGDYKPNEFAGSHDSSMVDGLSAGLLEMQQTPSEWGDRAAVNILTMPASERHGVAIWNPHNDQMPGNMHTGASWNINEPCGSSTWPSSAMLWVKRNHNTTGANNRHVVCVLEDSTHNLDWGNPAPSTYTFSVKRRHTVMLCDATRSHLGAQGYQWLSFRGAPGTGLNDMAYGLGMIRSCRKAGEGYYYNAGVTAKIKVFPTADCTAVQTDGDEEKCTDGDMGSVWRNGDIQFVSGACDYGEYMLLGDPDEWEYGDVKQTNYGIGEGTLVRIREGKAWRTGPGRAMVVSARAILVGNAFEEYEDLPHVIASFIGQVPTLVSGVVNDGDLLIPVDGELHCIGVSPEEATFEQYKKAIGTCYEKFSEERKAKMISYRQRYRLNCAIGIK